MRNFFYRYLRSLGPYCAFIVEPCMMNIGHQLSVKLFKYIRILSLLICQRPVICPFSKPLLCHAARPTKSFDLLESPSCANKRRKEVGRQGLTISFSRMKKKNPKSTFYALFLFYDNFYVKGKKNSVNKMGTVGYRGLILELNIFIKLKYI